MNLKLFLVVWITLSITIISLTYFLYEPVYFSYMSVKVGCNGLQVLENTSLMMVGYYIPSNDSINIIISNDSEKYNEVSKHELCHKNQAHEYRLINNCNLQPLMFLNEIECYINEKLP